MKLAFFAVKREPAAVDGALLLMRLVVGIAFILHGWGKIQHPFSWMGEGAMFPGIIQSLAALSEFGGGIALVLGLVTRLGAFGIACTMFVAVCMHLFVFGDPFVNSGDGGSYELASTFFTVAVLLLIIGPGRFSLDRLFFGLRG